MTATQPRGHRTTAPPPASGPPMTMLPPPPRRRHLNGGERDLIARARELAAMDERALGVHLNKANYLVYPIAFAKAQKLLDKLADIAERLDGGG
jgi:hypothetical protein